MTHESTVHAPSAERLGRDFAGRDPYMRRLGLSLVELGRGRAVIRMTVDPDHLNINGTCHGGAIFSLADTAFGYASNSHGRVAAGIDAHITFSTPARAGDVLTATATEETRSRRLATYRVIVERGPGKIVAGFTGTVFITDAEHEVG